MELRELFSELETARHGRPWGLEQIMLGFTGDVGDLAKLVQAATGMRQEANLQQRIAHELADCLWCVLVLADQLDVDLERAFSETMAELKTYARSRAGGEG